MDDRKIGSNKGRVTNAQEIQVNAKRKLSFVTSMLRI